MPRARFARLVLLVAIVAVPARADFFSQSPGALSSGHAALDKRDQCTACHTEGRALSNDKCLGCHDHANIKRRVDEGKGLHASAKVAGKACYLCHTEHKGRTKDILGFAALGGRDRFDHDLTGWRLDGKHASVTCERCHTERTPSGQRTYLGAPRGCDGCHDKESPHGELRPALRRCERCHDAESWKRKPRMEFDHDVAADARYPIEAKHERVACVDCHPKWRFRSVNASSWQVDCTPCHKNVHGASLFGQKRCALCHSAKVEWKTVKFDHAHQAHFPLDGAHAPLACRTCHPQSQTKRPEKTCASCHQDVHQARFSSVASDCNACHTTARWTGEYRFDHAAKTKFPLTGRHAEVDCRRCHRGKGPADWERFPKRVTPTAGCMSCHQHAEVHKRQFRDDECLRCHAQPGKNKFKREAVVRFHGPGSRFPLDEGHAGVACETCHKGDVYQGLPLACGPACHPDQLHQGSLGNDCLRCHEGGHWAATRFDHDQTSYPLIGHHQEAACEGCHPARRFQPTPHECVACHGQDDPHAGTLGPRCERCHSPTGRSLFDHNDPKVPGRFRLVGAHQKVRCQACHPTTVFPKVPTTCAGCHGEPDVHRGQLGTRCADCHDETSWKTIRTGHDAGSIHFGGAHDRLKCVVCHQGGQRRAGTADRCLDCHRKDDIHHNALGPRCGECHTQQTWSGAAVRYFHERSGCDLRGIHRTLPCLDCHVGGNFAALSPSCGACHRADAVKGASDPRAPAGHAGLTTCSACHNVNFFAPSRALGSESVCR